ncbi:Lysophospholipase, alpha-beta hydrolase superfamily [Lentibacillus persicus]|uniref:Lysophospholipase, alpha-beta hydrolase superfamily n=1 Tax=Lentibacillus persicus TaxID=640948 RepID=A0A1I1WKU2_9BACI|nr:alpha/beta hydrolase [Lentibacillus persicus]SFD95692.1 Lysophospholipase, alpha-beta hydrolase superfamily [Lentibacillus persicus]
MENTFWLKRPDNVAIYVRKWLPENIQDSKPKAVVQIAHGMVEHIGRYNEFAHFLTDNNIIVYGNDHRGHGRTGAKQGQLGYLADKNGFEKVTDDVLALTKQIKQEHPDLPVYLLGHSMGSFLARHYIQDHSYLIDGVILSGTGYYSRLSTTTAMSIASVLPSKEKSPFMNALVFSSSNKRVQNKKSSFDWLTSDDQIIQDFINDPYCGFIPSAGFFKDLMTGLSLIHDAKRNQKVRSDLPMLILSGAQDPVGNYTKGVWKTAALYDKAGLSNVITMLFENGRHELLNELNRDEIYHILLNWITGLTSRNA